MLRDNYSREGSERTDRTFLEKLVVNEGLGLATSLGKRCGRSKQT